MRRPHFLAHNKGSEYPRDVVVVDTETTEHEYQDGTTAHRLAFGWALYARRVRGDVWEKPQWFRFDDRSEFWSWVARRTRSRSRLVIYAHNVAFDGQVLNAFGELRRRGWRVTSACLEGPPTIIKWRRGARSIQFLDTLNLWRVPLAEIGRKVGMRKYSMPTTWANRERADRYCRRDVTIVWTALLTWWRFLRAHDLGNAAATLAGQAFTSYRHRFMPARIFIDANEQATALARRAYVGGRTECFRLGMIDEPGVTLDVNSMYPAVMRTLQCPTRLLTFRTTATLADLERYLQQYALVADVTLNTEEPAYPHLVDGRLCFPVGRFRQALATPELARAVSLGHVERVHELAIYERAELFREWVEWGWVTRLAARRRGDTLEDWLMRMLMNSLYGKFGQRGRQWEMAGLADDVKVASLTSWDADLGAWRHVRQLGRELQELVDKGEAINSMPAIAAHVTSAGRVMLWDDICAAGREHVHYCDTDSIKGARIIEEHLRHRIAAAELGMLKVEERWRWHVINGLKDYVSPTKARRKGVRSNAESNDGVAFAQLQWHGWAGSIARGRLTEPTTTTVVKVLSGAYTKGRVGQDGLIEPLRLPRLDAA